MSLGKLHFIGICGTAMGNTALMMRAKGWSISGSDSHVYPPMSDVLRAADVRINEGYAVEHLVANAPDIVVVGNAVGRGNPEVEYLLEHPEIRRISLPALLGEYLLRERHTLVVAGTHGKTTTTSLAAWWLREAGEEPGYLIGGVPQDLPEGWQIGRDHGPFVIEGDEYDSAFFDKRSKFVHYCPRGIILNNLEFDHADIFRDLSDIQRSVSHLLRILPNSGFVVTNGDDENLESLFPVAWGRVVRVGVGAHNDLRITDFSESQDGVSFRFLYDGVESPVIHWRLPGIYNVRNLLMAWAGSRLLTGKSPAYDVLLQKAGQFRGVKRRQDVLGSNDNWLFMEDFGHHPTAIYMALESFRNRYPKRRLYAMFEPRSNTMRTSVLQDALVDALSVADYAGIAPVHRAAMLKDECRLDTHAVVSKLRGMGIDASAFDDFTELEIRLKDLVRNEKEPAVMIFFTNGSFEGIPRRIAAG
jgi:UDP-N-acetylmuramate: L-alanyl-gamma-D-glutamyl-meso-diaminopimelate ligase